MNNNNRYYINIYTIHDIRKYSVLKNGNGYAETKL